MPEGMWVKPQCPGFDIGDTVVHLEDSLEGDIQSVNADIAKVRWLVSPELYPYSWVPCNKIRKVNGKDIQPKAGSGVSVRPD
jgi:hypothetical protein